ncbi:1-acyl-sn-glycerol-3-phosphate acyltransferase alpha [Liparis tanakae]|uniref:1-acyl-sn-glycerol-3-phosphate acyltransferase alpha n=1 Tax=Liparis tanakae TaxID=230148 RepID=A0A4Z2EV30_9TELE|nr:1-acyl-sn-glycerol-3-phosphate acyltransferase alpha [Liparis tanakae]
MDALWVIPLLLLPLLLWGSSTFAFYFKKCFYVGWMMVLALLAIPLCILKSGGRDVENMRVAFCRLKGHRRDPARRIGGHNSPGK